MMPKEEHGGMRATQVGTEHPAKWVREMQEYYVSNGSFRAEDVRRVLGDQRDVVGIAADTALFAAAISGKK